MHFLSCKTCLFCTTGSISIQNAYHENCMVCFYETDYGGYVYLNMENLYFGQNSSMPLLFCRSRNSRAYLRASNIVTNSHPDASVSPPYGLLPERNNALINQIQFNDGNIPSVCLGMVDISNFFVTSQVGGDQNKWESARIVTNVLVSRADMTVHEEVRAANSGNSILSYKLLERMVQS